MTAIEESINFILSHFQEPIFPRRIFTPIQKQIKIDRGSLRPSIMRSRRHTDFNSPSIVPKIFLSGCEVLFL